MTAIRITYLDSEGRKQAVTVDKSSFIIGRHSECDLTIADSRLSRKHARIDKIGDFFVLSDLDSSNGTTINGKRLGEPVTLSDGDIVGFGGVEVNVEVEKPLSRQTRSALAAQSASPSVSGKTINTADTKTGIPFWLLFAGPAVAAVLVIIVGIVIFIAVSRNSNAADEALTNANEDISDIEKEPKRRKTSDRETEPDKALANKSDMPPTSTSPETAVPAATASPDSEQAKIEANAAKFLRRIAQNDPKAFLTSDQAKIVAAKTKEFTGSAALADNIKSARKNSAKLRSLAAAKNVKPLFLAVAAMTKLGNSRGDVLATAQTMADTLDKLTIQLGNELADDCLLTIAAYNQGAAGETMKLRNLLQDLATKFPQSSREIRTIWFLQKQSKITPAEFDMAIRFLAIGAITQNPAAFGVNAEALDL
jgi:hypothetical protein